MIRRILRHILDKAILIVFFLVPWWFRPDGMPSGAYFFGFLITIPVTLSIVTWVLLGFPGLRSTLLDRRSWWIGFASLLLLWAFLSVGWAKHASDASSAAQQLAGVLLFTLVVCCAGPSARAVTTALATGLIFQGVITVAQVQLQHPVGLSSLGEFEIRPNNAGLSILDDGTAVLMRPYGLTIHPNVIGGYFAVALIAMLGWLTDCGLSRWRVVVRIGVTVLGFWALCLTFSRSAWGGFLVGFIAVLFWWQRRRLVQIPRRRLLVAAAGAAVVLVLFGVSYSTFLAARAGAGDETTTELRSISDREVLIGFAVQIIRAHPLVGVGIGNFPWAASDMINQSEYRGWMGGENVHNIHLLALAELGIIGAVSWIAVWSTGFWFAFRTVTDPYAVAIAGGALVLLAIGMLDHYPWSIFHFSLLMWSCLGVALNPRHRTTSA